MRKVKTTARDKSAPDHHRDHNRSPKTQFDHMPWASGKTIGNPGFLPSFSIVLPMMRGARCYFAVSSIA